MRVYRIFLKNLTQGRVRILGSEAHHLIKVLRVQLGTKVQAFDGNGLEAEGEVVALEPQSITLDLEQPNKGDIEPKWKITLAVALLKGDKLTNVVRQGTEIGAVRFIPILTKYCDVRIFKEAKFQRLQSIAKEAAKQCGRGFIPTVTELVNLTELQLGTLNLVAHPFSTTMLQDAVETYPTNQNLNILCVTGPEGGLSEDEVHTLQHKGFQSVNLGPRLLRAESAPIALTAALLLPRGQ